jgi:hypothetical protein
LPKQNRPLVRDGRIQARKKRTDRSYLRPDASATGVAEQAEAEEELAEARAVEEAAAVEEAPAPEVAAPEAEAEVAPPEAGVADEPATVSNMTAAPARVNGATSSTNAAPAPGRLTGTARALQQQGVRKRREFDVEALAIRDSKYAMHEIRRIAILATMVIITLIVLSFVLR